MGPTGFDSNWLMGKHTVVCMSSTLNKRKKSFVNGNITNEVGSKADVLAVIKAMKAKPLATQVEELEFAA